MNNNIKSNKVSCEGTNLDKILEQFVDVEYGMISYITILKDLEELYDQKDKEESRKLTITTITQLTSLQKELTETITKLEVYISQA